MRISDWSSDVCSSDLAWVEVMKKRDDVRHLLRRQDKTRHITVIDLKTLQERWLQSVDRILPVETSKRRCEPVGARIGFADGVTTRASPLLQVAASRHLFRAPGRREGTEIGTQSCGQGVGQYMKTL